MEFFLSYSKNISPKKQPLPPPTPPRRRMAARDASFKNISSTFFFSISFFVTQVSGDDACPHTACGPPKVCELKVSHVSLFTIQTNRNKYAVPINLGPSTSYSRGENLC